MRTIPFVFVIALSACSRDDPSDHVTERSDAGAASMEMSAAASDASADADDPDSSPRDAASEGDLRDAASEGLRDASEHDARAALDEAGSSLPRNDAGLDASESANSERDASLTSGATDYAVATVRVEISVRDGRRLPLQLWYPAVQTARAEAAAGHPIGLFEPEGSRRALLERLSAAAPSPCVTRTMHAALAADADTSEARLPLLVFSHHLEGMRVAMFSQAERLAARGFVVAAPDHTGLTLYDRTDDLSRADLLGIVLRFNPEQLAIRARDIENTIDVLLDPAAQAIPAGVRGRIDPARIGVFGHSMGSITMGVVAARDTRVRAAAFLSFPPARTAGSLDLTGQPEVSAFRVPALFLLNQEDASLNTIGGNDTIRALFAAYPALAYLVEVKDTGHWSFADDCALIPDFQDGCGSGMRSSTASAETFRYLDNDLVREIAARHLVAFFASQLLGRASEARTEPSSPHELVRFHAAQADAGR